MFYDDSDTDYTTLEAAGLPGMDIAFYAPRSHYHTPLDHLNYTTPSAVQHMGQMVLATLQAIDKTDGFFDEDQESQLVYYDVLGKIMFAYNFDIHGLGNGIALVLTPLLALVWTLLSQQTHVTSTGYLAKRVTVVIQGFVATLFAFFVTVLFVGISAFTLLKMNPMVQYRLIIKFIFELHTYIHTRREGDLTTNIFLHIGHLRQCDCSFILHVSCRTFGCRYIPIITFKSEKFTWSIIFC